METYYLVHFETDRGKTVKLKIGRAKPGVTQAAAKAALNGMISANVMSPDYGNLIGVAALQYVTVTRTPLNLA